MENSCPKIDRNLTPETIGSPKCHDVQKVALVGQKT